MAVAPLFVASMDLLKAKLRLSGSSSADAARMIDDAVESVRVGFINHLGEVRVGQLVATAYTENALTAAAILRTKANILEITWVRLKLLRRLPTLFMDASGVQQQAWNEEQGFARDNSTGKEIDRLEDEVLQGLEELAGTSDDGGSMTVETFGPKEAWIPGQSIAPSESVAEAC